MNFLAMYLLCSENSIELIDIIFMFPGFLYLLKLIKWKEASLRLFNAATSEKDKARLNCVSREGSGDWLTALPSKALGLHLRMSEFILAVRYRLGLPIFLQEGNCPMNRCRGFGDKYGDHAISCAINGERIAKHNQRQKY